jgi:hypothetical protein
MIIHRYITQESTILVLTRFETYRLVRKNITEPFHPFLGVVVIHAGAATWSQYSKFSSFQIQMKLLNFGQPDKKNDPFVRLTAKTLAMIIPAIILGHYIDVFMTRQSKRISKRASVLIQTLINVSVIYVLHIIDYAYTKEFQTTFAGLFFSGLFFGLQTNYIANIKSVL